MDTRKKLPKTPLFSRCLQVMVNLGHPHQARLCATSVGKHAPLQMHSQLGVTTPGITRRNDLKSTEPQM